MSRNDFSYTDVLRQQQQRGYTSMVKPVGSLCNMRCKYCYYLDKAALYDYHEPKMDDTLLENYIRNTIEGNNLPVISFAWHGGEPLIAGLDFYRKAVALQKKYAGGKQIENSLQTNGLLVNREWCQFWRDENFLIGISIDGPQHIHDAHRLDAAGKGTFSRVMRAVDTMVRCHVEFNTLSTINCHSEGHGAEVYSFLRSFSSFMQFLPVAELISDGTIQCPESDRGQIAPWSVSPEGFGEFMCDVFDQWIVKDVGSRYVQLFDATLANMVGVMPSICSLCETCGTGLTVEHNGDVYSCDHFVYPQYKIGNINSERMCDLAFSQRQFQFGVEKRSTLPRECQHCRYQPLCHGECPKHRFTRDASGESFKNYLCDGYKIYFEHTLPYMQTMRDLLLKGQAPALVMQMARMSLRK